MLPLIFATVLTIVASAAPSATVVCAMEFDGNKFLVAAEGRGLKPEAVEACSTVDVGRNQFFALADHQCKLLFGNLRWLKRGSFQSITGQGKFAADRSKAGVLITIEPEGGFRAILFKIELHRESCEGLTLTDVLQ